MATSLEAGGEYIEVVARVAALQRDAHGLAGLGAQLVVDDLIALEGAPYVVGEVPFAKSTGLDSMAAAANAQELAVKSAHAIAK